MLIEKLILLPSLVNSTLLYDGLHFTSLKSAPLCHLLTFPLFVSNAKTPLSK
nr:MAG TPA: hypothetical protein [Bacteriophage sp.]